MTWLEHAVCRDDPDMWFTASERQDAVHICRAHCPVIRECLEALRELQAYDIRIHGGVMAGLPFAADGSPMGTWGVGKSVGVCGVWCRAYRTYRRTAGEGEAG